MGTYFLEGGFMFKSRSGTLGYVREVLEELRSKADRDPDTAQWMEMMLYRDVLRAMVEDHLSGLSCQTLAREVLKVREINYPRLRIAWSREEVARDVS